MMSLISQDNLFWIFRNNARNAMTPSVSAVTVIERQRQSTATLTPNHPSTATLVRTRSY